MNPPAFPSSEIVRRRRGWAFGILLLVAVLLVGGIWYFGFGPGADLRAAEAALARNDPASARPRLDHRLTYWPSDKQALFLAARAARRDDAYADAERFLTRYEDVYGSTEESKLEWSLLGAQQGDFQGDAGRLRGSLDPKNPNADLISEALAKGLRAEFRFEPAIGELNRLIERVPDQVLARVLRGTLNADQRHMAEAEVDLRKAVEIAPDNFNTHLALAGFLTHTGHSREAIAHYECVLRMRPGDPTALLGLARALSDAADTVASAAKLDELLSANPNHVDGLTERGRLALQTGDPATAETFLLRAVKDAPWNRDATRYLLASQTGRKPDEAARTAARVSELKLEDGVDGRLKNRVLNNPTDNAARWELWLWSKKNGQLVEGVAWLLEILRFDARHTQAHAALAEYFEQAGQPRRAANHRNAAAAGLH